MLASDAFFPFADGPAIALDAGIAALIQPGGSKRDDEVIAAVEANGRRVGPHRPAALPALSGSVDALDAHVEEQLAAWQVPGLAIGILENGETTARGYGVAGLETGEPVTPETSFRVASVTKPMVGTLCLELGLPLDERVWEDTTLRLALSHQIGIDRRAGRAAPLRRGRQRARLDPHRARQSAALVSRRRAVVVPERRLLARGPRSRPRERLHLRGRACRSGSSIRSG